MICMIVNIIMWLLDFILLLLNLHCNRHEPLPPSVEWSKSKKNLIRTGSKKFKTLSSDVLESYALRSIQRMNILNSRNRSYSSD